MRATIRCFAIALIFLALAQLAGAQIVHLVVDDTIQPISAEYISRGIDAANARHADAVLIDLRTPGGLETSMREIVQKILASPIPVIVYVSPSGARAASAGFFILESADIAAMAPGTNTGAAHPVMMGGGKMDDVMAEKVTNDASAFLRSYASKRGHDAKIAESAVRESKSFTDQEALQDHLIDVVATSDQDLLQKLNGHEIARFDGSKAVLHTGDKPLQSFDMTLKEQILGFLMDPNMSFVLLAVGLLALYVEFNHPGAVVPGVVGFFFVVLAIFALNILPVRYTALALILVAFIFFALEAKFASHGVLTIAGIVSLTFGALLLVDSPIPQMRVHIWTALAVSVPLGVITSFLMTVAVRARRNKVTTGQEGLMAETGVVHTPFAPEGKIFIRGEIWNAVGDPNLKVGQHVRVTSVDGLTLHVEPVTTVEGAAVPQTLGS